jgi:hypothetical protein
MGNPSDTIKVEIVTDEFLISEKKDNVIVIEQKDKAKDEKSFTETPLFTTLIVPIIVLIVGFILNRIWFWHKEKKDGKKVDIEIDKMKAETTQIKKSFQPIVLTTLMQSQEYYRGDKVKALKEIVNYKTDLFYVEQYYDNGELVTDSMFEYHSDIYRRISPHKVKEISAVVNNYGYLFPDIIINKLKDLQSDISNLNNIWSREASVQNQEMPDDAELIMNKLSEKFEKVIGLIRNDLHVDNGFINEFIQEYKDLNKS